ncbi:MAG: phenylacetic acid degradation operon negative regulatory protein [Acidimicrobiaceae bacterium]|nr:MAG: phenylacetic acid degradation operon negative regulatory protein [Acidimicrobiaceae bacterium]
MPRPSIVAIARATESPRNLIITIYGAFVRDLGGSVTVAALVRLLGELGIDGAASRSAINRLKQQHLLERDERHGRPGYVASASLIELLRDGDERIFGSTHGAELTDGWLIVVFTVPESERDQRHLLRTRLHALGCAPMSPGVWIAPRRTEGDVRRMLVGLSLDRYVSMFVGDYVGFAELDRLAEAWDVAPLRRNYQRFITRHRRAAARGVRSPAAAFSQYVPLLDGWRHLVFEDPGLPDALTPHAELRREAFELFGAAAQALAGSARQHVVETIAAGPG